MRDIPPDHAVCPVCDRTIRVATTKARGDQPTPIRSHTARCPGSGHPGKSWTEAQGLPDWADMSDLDRGCALLFLWACHGECSDAYAREHYPCRYRDDPRLVELTPDDACRHAGGFGWYSVVRDRIGNAETKRLYDLALAAEDEEADT